MFFEESYVQLIKLRSDIIAPFTVCRSFDFNLYLPVACYFYKYISVTWSSKKVLAESLLCDLWSSILIFLHIT